MSLRAALLGVALIVAGGAAAQPIDAARSQVDIGVRLRWWQRLQCDISRFEGELSHDAAGQAVVVMRMDVRSLEVDGNDVFTRMARSADFFDVERFPWVVFESAPFDPELLRRGGTLHGELFVRGIFRPIVLEVAPTTCATPGADCPIAVEGAISRHAFGMNKRRFLLLDKVRMRFSMYLDVNAGREVGAR